MLVIERKVGGYPKSRYLKFYIPNVNTISNLNLNLNLNAIAIAIAIAITIAIAIPNAEGFFLLPPPIAIAIAIAIAIPNLIRIANRKANKKATVKWPF